MHGDVCACMPDLAGRSLVSLDLSDNPLTGEVAQSLAEALRGQENLRVLNLNDTSLGDEGLESLAEVGPL